jgi:ABC-type glycerol-3-phosphate transport system permease component
MAADQVPESRVYRHITCGGETTISGSPFEVITNPLAAMSRTWCSDCNAYFPPDQYVWADTDEKITDYWARHGSRATSLEHWLCSKTMLVVMVVIGLVAGLILGYALFRQKTPGVLIFMTGFMGLMGVFAAAALFISVITKFIVWRVCGVTDTRVLK